MTPTPLNGVKTHRLKEHSLNALRVLVRGPWPALEFNPGVINRLLRETLAEIILQESPYKTHKGKKINFLQITDAGRTRLEEEG